MLSVGCREKYIPDIPNSQKGILVVEGFINLGTGPTIIQLTRSAGLDSAYLSFETGARLEVQTEGGASFPLTEQGRGKYTIDQVPLMAGERYRLHILTSNGRNYLSDLSEVNMTPPIDSVNWKMNGDQVAIFVSTHDPQNKTSYYQWQFEETWQYTAMYQSLLTYTGNSVISRPTEEQIFNCWRSDNSNTILISSSADLTEDVISQFPVTEVPVLTTDKLVLRYSILVKQYGLSKDWYEWIQKVKKNTEQLGSLFDPQPSGTGGNIHSVSDPDEMVIGWVGCTTETDKRIFIDHKEVPGSYPHGYPVTCALDTVDYDSAAIVRALSIPGRLPVEYIRSMFSSDIIGITVSSSFCADCNLQGGSSVKPVFWQE